MKIPFMEKFEMLSVDFYKEPDIRSDTQLNPSIKSISDNSSGLLYTLDATSNFKLSLEERQFYEENGYLVVPNLFESDMLEQFRQRFQDISEGRIPRGGMTVVQDISLRKLGVKGERLVNKVQDFNFDDVLAQYCDFPPLLDFVQCFTGPNIVAAHTMLINKPPDAGTLSSRHPMHQDLHYFPFRPANRIVCAWTAMEHTFPENGCLFVLPGSHREGILHNHVYPDWEEVNKAYHGVRGFEDKEKLYLEMNKGDTVLFHPLLLHGSGANNTQGFRKAISCHFAASECDLIDVRGTSQDNIISEVGEIAKKKFGLEGDFRDIWTARARLVRGIPVNFSGLGDFAHAPLLQSHL